MKTLGLILLITICAIIFLDAGLGIIGAILGVITGVIGGIIGVIGGLLGLILGIGAVVVVALLPILILAAAIYGFVKLVTLA